MKSNPYQSTLQKIQSAPGPGGLEALRKTNSLTSLYDDEASVFEKNWKVSEMMNPDGSVTVKRMVLNKDGSKSVKTESYPQASSNSPPRTINASKLRRSGSESSFSSITTTKTRGSKSAFSQNYFMPSLPQTQVYGDDDDDDSTDISYLLSSSDSTSKKSSKSSTEDTEHLVPIRSRNCLANVLLDVDDGDFEERLKLSPYFRPMNPVPFENGDRSVGFSEFASSATTNLDELSTQSSSQDIAINPNFMRPEIHRTQQQNIEEEKEEVVAPVAEENPASQCPENSEFEVHVTKTGPDDKIGINVGVKQLKRGMRLVVSKVSPNGKFAGTAIQPGDIILSINGVSFLHNPKSADAFDIVRSARKITIIAEKGEEEALNRSLDGLSRSLSYEHGIKEIINQDLSKTVSREVWHDDGSRTEIVDNFDASGVMKKRSTKTWKVGADGKITLLQGEELTKPSRLFSDDSTNVSGDMNITVKKKSREQNAGLSLMTSVIMDRTVLFVADIHPYGLFARTPLRVGDIVVSINNFSFRDSPDAQVALSIIDAARGDLRVIARKSDPRLQEIVLKRNQERQEHQPAVGGPRKTPDLTVAYGTDFNEEAYGASMETYQSARIATFKKLSPNEDVQLDMARRLTKLGSLLTISAIPNLRIRAAGLQVGDAILSINGVNFRENPDPIRAATIIRNSPSTISIEFQPLLRMKTAIPSGTQNAPIITESIKPNGVRCVRSETIHPDGSKTIKVEEFDPTGPVHIPIKRIGSDVSALDSVVTGISHGGRNHVDWQIQASQEKTIETVLKPQGVPKSSKTHFQSKVSSQHSDLVVVTVKKKTPSQEVGISMATMDGSLYVTKVSPSSLLLGKPVLPGDTILTINKVDFQHNPDARRAFAAIMNAPDTVRFEILKTSNKKTSQPDRVVKIRKPGLCERLRCSRRTHPDPVLAKTGKSKTVYKNESSHRGGTAEQDDGFDPFYA